MQHRSALPAIASPAPIAAGGMAGALVIGVLLARDLQLGTAMMIGLLYAPIALLNLPLGVVLWIPLVFLERLPATSFGPTLVLCLVAVAWLGTLPARGAFVASVMRRHQGLLVCLALLVAWVTMSISWAQDTGDAAHGFWGWYVVAVIFVIVATSFTDRRYVAAACGAFVVGALLSAVVGLIPGAVNTGTVAADEASRLSGSFGDANFLAAGLVPAIALIPGLAAVWRGATVRWVLVGTAGALAIALVATASRGGLVAGIVSVFAAVLLARGRRVQVGALLAVGVVVSGLWVATSSPATWDRVREFDTGTGRIDLWTVAGRMAEAHPLAGVGINNYQEASTAYIREPGNLPEVQELITQPHVAHNTYLQQLAETGVVGLALLITVIGASLRAAWQASRRFELAGDSPMAALARALLVAQLGVLSASLFISNSDDKRIWILLALGPAMLAVALREERRAVAP